MAERKTPPTAAQILARIDEVELWVSLLRCTNPKVRRDARKYLMGKHDKVAKRALEAAGCDRDS